VAIAGTGTAVGKTWVTTHLATRLGDRGLRVAARKPAQSYAPDELGRTDAELLANATGETAITVCPRHRWYPVPFAPPMAADALGLPPFTIAMLAQELAASWTAPPADIALVELAGGPRSPMAIDGDGVALVAAIAADVVVLVADAGLGTINSATLAHAALADSAIVVFLNRYVAAGELHRRNRDWLMTALGCPVVTDLDSLRDTVY
jgi:dethiobiotin synthetase